MFFSCEMPSQFKLTNLNDLISENLELLKIQLNEANIRVVTNFEKELPPYKVDAIQFSQVIFNLVLNAITAMEGGGKLTVHTILIDSQIQIFVQDTGVGIEKDKLSKIFDPFYTTNLSKGGTGLGLAVSYGIIQAHGGRIEVDSEVGFGTSFKIVLKR
jgi:signal transduction histidine kinase